MEELYNMDETPVEKVSENEEKHLNHPFYAEANQYRETVRREQVLKGAHKYPEPFTTASWTNQEIIDHAMQENVDQAHYIYAAKERMEIQQGLIRTLTAKANSLIGERDKAREGCEKYRGELDKLTIISNGNYNAMLEVEKERDQFKKQYLKAHAEIQDLHYKLKLAECRNDYDHDCSKNQAIHWQGKDIVKVKCQICDKTLYQA